MKKCLSFILTITLLLTLSLGTMAAEAAPDEGTVLAGETLQEAAAAVVKEFTGAGEDATVTFHEDMAAVLDTNGDHIVTAGEAASSMASYLFADASTLDGEAARIAEESTYKVTVTDDGKTTVYVFVDIANNPALFNLSVFSDTVAHIVEKQTDAAAGAENVSLLTYEQIAGELALHEILYVFTDTFGGAEEGNTLHGYYEQAKDAALNIDESRVPSWLINFFGTLLALLGRIMSALQVA